MIWDPESIIFLIDDDETVRKGISLLLVSGGYNVEMFENPKDFLSSDYGDRPGCILLDIFLNGESGLALQDAIRLKFTNLPIIYITGHGDVPMSVQALRKGALNFLQKPVTDKQLFQAVDEALNYSRSLVIANNERAFIKTKLNALTPREFQIFSYVIMGMLNKQIASALNIAEHTVKLHRGKITEKLGVKSVAELIYMAEKLSIK